MKNLKLIIAAVLFMTGTMAMAQDSEQAQKENAQKACCVDRNYKDGDKMGHHSQMKERLNLTEEQVAEIKVIREKRAPEKKQLREKLQELNKAERAEINEVLTEEQRIKMKEMKMGNKRVRTMHNPVKQDLQKMQLETK